MLKGWVDLKIEKRPINYPLIIGLLFIGIFIPVIFFYLNKRLPLLILLMQQLLLLLAYHTSLTNPNKYRSVNLLFFNQLFEEIPSNLNPHFKARFLALWLSSGTHVIIFLQLVTVNMKRIDLLAKSTDWPLAIGKTHEWTSYVIKLIGV